MDIETDLAVIGAGSGGLTVAAGAVQLGARVVLVEKGKMGGDCLNYGCVPSKSLLAAAHAARTANAKLGVRQAQPEIDYAAVNRHVKNVIAAIAPHDSVERFTSLGVKVIHGAAKFSSPKTLKVGDDTIRAKFFVIATGSSAVVPPIPGLANCPYFTNETIFDNTELPQHLLVIGGGPIGMEMAQAHALLGAKVSVVDLATILPRDNQELVKLAREQFVRDGIDFYEQVSIKRISQTADGLEMVFNLSSGEETKLQGSHLLVAAGRRANIDNLGLEEARVKAHPRGLVTNARLQTTNRKIYAIGDVASPYQFTHVATYHAGIVIRNILFRLPAKVDYKALPWVTYTTPEVAHCGMSNAEAVAKYGKAAVRTLEWSFSENDRAQAELATSGKIQVFVHKKGRILGVDLVGPNAGDLIQIWALAIQNNLKIGAVAGYISPYPTLGEVSKRAAGSFYTKTLFDNPRLKRLVRFLLRLP